jgi:hypothetical protein
MIYKNYPQENFDLVHLSAATKASQPAAINTSRKLPTTLPYTYPE